GSGIDAEDEHCLQTFCAADRTPAREGPTHPAIVQADVLPKPLGGFAVLAVSDLKRPHSGRAAELRRALRAFQPIVLASLACAALAAAAGAQPVLGPASAVLDGPSADITGLSGMSIARDGTGGGFTARASGAPGPGSSQPPPQAPSRGP